MNTIVVVANASLFNLRVEMPIYSQVQKDGSEREVAKVNDFQVALRDLRAKTLVEKSRFRQLLGLLKTAGVLAAPQLIDVNKLFALLRKH